MKKLLLLALLLFPSIAYAQQNTDTGAAVRGVPIDRSTLNSSVVITTGGTFQTVLTSVAPAYTSVRQALTIENNNTTDNCYLHIGTGTPSAGNSILLLPGGSYTRYWPFIPSDAFQATCANNSDTLYIDVQ
jgi:hypothetical protein